MALAAAACAQTPQERLAAAQESAAAASGLQKELAGLTPGAPMACMPRLNNTQIKAYGPTLVYSVSRTLKYRTDTAGGCERVARGDILVTQSPLGQLCQGDIATTVDQGSRMQSGSCSLGQFVRYERPAR
jgi:hypothetical protein